MKGTNSQQESDPEQETGEQQEADQERGGGEGHRIRAMEEPYEGPDDRRGISAHGIEGETNLRRAKQYAEMIVDTVHEGLLVLNFDLRVEAANESFYRMFEVDPSETEGRIIYDLGNGQWDIPELRELLEEILPERKVMTGYMVTCEFERIGQRVMRLNARQLNEHRRILLAVEDVTEREEIEEQLRLSEEKLREMNRSLEKRVEKRTGELREQTERLRRMALELASAEQRERRRLASLLHDDLQQLLYGAEMQLGMVRSMADVDTVRTAIDEVSERIGEAVEAARSLTCQLRPPALYEAGLAPALKWLASDMAERYNLDVVVDTDEVQTDSVEHVLSDDIKAMLYECARELLFNTVKYAGVDEAYLALRIDTDSSSEDQSSAMSADRLRLVVEDEGQGFEVDRAIGDYTEEGGLGLVSVRERIAALGGSMEIDASPGEGTRIELALPLAASLNGEQVWSSGMAEGLEASPSEESQPEEHRHPSQVRVVVADDHAVVRQGIANLLAVDGRTTVVGEASDGYEALKVVERERPDAVIMDLNMPEMNGIEATREIRSRWPDMAVIGISVQSDRTTEQSMLEAGAAAFVPKSGDIEQIIDTILRVTGHHSQAGKQGQLER